MSGGGLGKVAPHTETRRCEKHTLQLVFGDHFEASTE